MSTSSQKNAATEAPQTPQQRLDAVKELPLDEPNDVVFGSLYGLRTIQLNRPKKLNSLNASMIRKIVPRLREWEKSDMANVVVIKGAGDKAFCAGGDVAALALHNQSGGWRESAAYFALEYQLDHYIATYRKPYVALMDGITMGGGVGLSVHAPFRIATERTVFAMPETTIGFFPDVGASFFLPRLNGAVGTYLGLTSERLTGVNVFYSGVATHYVHSTSLNALESRLAELRFHDYDDLPARLRHIGETIEEFATGLPHDTPMLLAGELRAAVDRCFSRRTVPEVLAALEAERGPTEAWARRTIETLHKRSPTSVHVTLRQLQMSRGWGIRETFMREYEMAKVFMRGHDFTEGVSALLIRKDAPKWQPASLEDIGPRDRVAEPYVNPAPEDDGTEELGFFNDVDYAEYPHVRLGVPTEAEVKAHVRGRTTPEEVRRAVVASREGRQGVAEVVDEILRRKVTTDESGRAQWVD